MQIITKWGTTLQKRWSTVIYQRLIPYSYAILPGVRLASFVVALPLWLLSDPDYYSCMSATGEVWLKYLKYYIVVDLLYICMYQPVIPMYG